MKSHAAISDLIYDPVETAWIGFVRLPLLEASAGSAPAAPSESLTEILDWLRTYRSKFNGPGDERQRTAQEEFDDWDAPQAASRAEIRIRVWSRWIGKLVRIQRSRALLSVEFTSPDESPINPVQQAALAHLIANELAIAAEVRGAIANSAEYYGAQDRAESAIVSSIRIHDDGLDGIASIQFGIECDWEVEHGMAVVYHPRTGTDWATLDTVDELIAAACPEPPPAPPPTPEEELVTAIIMRDTKRMNELLVRGVKAEPASGSALFGPILERDIDAVRLLLTAGANPNRSDLYEGSPLQAARRALAEGTLRLPRKAPWWMKALVVVPKLVNFRRVRAERRKGRAIIQALTDAGAKPAASPAPRSVSLR